VPPPIQATSLHEPAAPTSLPLVPSMDVEEVVEQIPTTRNEVWAYADAMVREWGADGDTEDREALWEAIVSYRNPQWVVGLSKRMALLRADGIDPMTAWRWP